MANVAEWTERDLQSLVGQPESSRLEFKSGKLVAERSNLIQTLSKEVSAFANSEGGVIVLGLSERTEGKSKVADVVDGYPAGTFAPEWLQQVIESNVSPFLPGIRLRTIRLSERQDHVCTAISVPAGSTAYQASDCRYYGRSEHSVMPLPDHEVRLRMQRGRAPRAEMVVLEPSWGGVWDDFGSVSWEVDLNVRDVSPNLSQEEIQAINERAEREPTPEASELSFSFSLGVRNCGELTLRNFLVELTFRGEGGAIAMGRVSLGGEAALTQRVEGAALRVLPSDCLEFPKERWTAMFDDVTSARSATVLIDWTVFLDDAPPSRGTIDIIQEITRLGLLVGGEGTSASLAE